MNIFDESIPPPRRIGSRCEVCKALDDMEPDVAQRARERLAEPIEQLQHVQLSVAFKKLGYPVNDYTIGRHRRGLCNGS